MRTLRERLGLSASAARAMLGLGAIALAAYLPGFWWGTPHATSAERAHAWGVDDATPLGALGQLHNVVGPHDNQNFGYPLMHPFIVGIVSVPYLAYRWVRGDLRPVTSEFPYGFRDPATAVKRLAWIASLISVVMGAVVVVAAVDIGNTLWNLRAGVFGGLVTMVSYPMFYYSRTGNVDMLVLCFTALALAVFARILKSGFAMWRCVWLGIWVGFAAGTKEPSAASFVAIPFVLLGLQLYDVRKQNGGSWGRFWTASGAAVAASFLAFGLGSGLFVDPDRFFAHLKFISERVSAASSGGIAFVTSFPNTWRGNVDLSRVLAGYLIDALTLPGLLLAASGVVWSARRSPRQVLFAVSAVSYLAVLFATARIGMLRYLMPVAFTLAPFAGYTLATLWSHPRRAARLTAGAVLAVVLGLGGLRGVDLTYEMIRDSRYTASLWLREHAHAGDRLEYFGPVQKLPRLNKDLEISLAAEYLGAIVAPVHDSTGAAALVEGWRRRVPDFIIVIPDHSSQPGVPHSATLHPQVYEQLLNGSLDYRLAAVHQTGRLMPWLPRPDLDYPSVNPPIRIFVPAVRPSQSSRPAGHEEGVDP